MRKTLFALGAWVICALLFGGAALLVLRAERVADFAKECRERGGHIIPPLHDPICAGVDK
jgi:hypothetical protein